MSEKKNNGDFITFLMQKKYVMVNNNLGAGSFGKTVLLKDPFIDELFVAKKYEPEFDDNDFRRKFYKNFLDEIKILHKLNHKNIVRIYNYYAYEDYYTGYILMEYIEGQNIKDFLDTYDLFGEGVSLDDIFTQLIEAFCCIEEHGIIHRDIREGNILIDYSGVVKVIDFGIGKIFKKNEKNQDDSLVSKINRAGLDVLPIEYYDGTYSNQTDMFYLGELLNRLLRGKEDNEVFSFSYYDILEKMMRIKPEDRFQSFKEIMVAIKKRDFSNLEISEEDKEIYQDFTNSIRNAVASYSTEPRFNMSPESFLTKLKTVIEDNLFENHIQNNSAAISCFVECGYKYHVNRIIYMQTVTDFVKWFEGYSLESQKLILRNFATKLSTIKLIKPEVEIPF